MWNDVHPRKELPLGGEELKLLLQRAKDGDREALGQVFERMSPFLLQIANEELDPRLRQKAGGSDIVQQTLLEAGQSLVAFEGSSPDAFVAWLRRILLNNIANHRRFFQTEKRNVHREIQFGGDGSAARRLDEIVQVDMSKSDDLRKQEELEIVGRAFAMLSEDYQRVIRCRNEEKKSFAEIGLLMDRSEDAARKLWARAVEALRTAIDKLGQK